MHRSSEKRVETLKDLGLVCGRFSKKEAAERIAGGIQHVHSSISAARDENAKMTQNFLESGCVGEYAWEVTESQSEHNISSSSGRHDFIHGVILSGKLPIKRVLGRKVQTIVEELLTNAIYHGYQNPDGSARYSRRDNVTLPTNEQICVSVGQSGEGLSLRIRDKGGSLQFQDIQKSFARCYSNDKEGQIEQKESGAGLGIYMVFELATHLKIFCEPGLSTTISCWLSAKNENFDIFSFNYFERR